MWPYKSPPGHPIPRKCLSVPEPLWRQLRDQAATKGMTITRHLHELANPTEGKDA